MRSLSVESLLMLNFLYFSEFGRLWHEDPHSALTGYEFCRSDVLKSAKHPFCSTKVFTNIKKMFSHSNAQKVYDRGINVIALSYPVKPLSTPGSQEPHTHTTSSSLKNSKMLSKL